MLETLMSFWPALAGIVDLVPDFVPVLGNADDAIIVALVLRSVVRAAGPQALEGHWPVALPACPRSGAWHGSDRSYPVLALPVSTAPVGGASAPGRRRPRSGPGGWSTCSDPHRGAPRRT